MFSLILSQIEKVCKLWCSLGRGSAVRLVCLFEFLESESIYHDFAGESLHRI